MRLRTLVIVGGLVPAMLVSVVACSSSSATSAPPASASPGASASAAASTAASAEASAAASVPASAAGGGQSGLPDPATLLTADMAASVIGGSPAKVNLPGSFPNMSIVSYGVPGGDSVTLFIEEMPTSISAAVLQAAVAQAGAQGQLQVINGLGDAAGKTVDAHETVVAFVKGGTLAVLEASASSLAGSDMEPKLEALAQQIAGKV